MPGSAIFRASAGATIGAANQSKRQGGSGFSVTQRNAGMPNGAGAARKGNKNNPAIHVPRTRASAVPEHLFEDHPCNLAIAPTASAGRIVVDATNETHTQVLSVISGSSLLLLDEVAEAG